MTPPPMTREEFERTRRLGAVCRSRGCRCLRRCWHAWNRYWIEKAEVCTHPNWAEPDDEERQ